MCHVKVFCVFYNPCRKRQNSPRPLPPAAGLSEKWLSVKEFLVSIKVMPRLVGYMVTWTTYGSWLPGDKRGYVENGRVLEGNKSVRKACEKLQKYPTVKLNKLEKEIVRTAIIKEAERIGQKIETLAVCSNHIHIAARPGEKSIERTVCMYKSAATRALRSRRKGPVWTKSFDKRFCFSEADLASRIKYIKNHNE